MIIWLSIGMTVAVILYTASLLFYQPDFMWIVIPIALLLSLVLLHKTARRRAFGISSIIGIVAVPLIATIGFLLVAGPSALFGASALRFLVGLLLFGGLYVCLSMEHSRAK